MNSIPTATVHLLASDATPATGIDAEIVTRQRMAPLAMGLPGVPGRSALAPKNVDRVSHRFQMIGIHTGPVAAKMIDSEAIRDWADPQLIGETVGEHLFTSRSRATRPEVTVSLAGLRASPEPALVSHWGNLNKEAFENSHAYTVPQMAAHVKEREPVLSKEAKS